jgi:hypothetical protein
LFFQTFVLAAALGLAPLSIFFIQINFEIFVGKLADHFEPIFIVIAPRTNEIID